MKTTLELVHDLQALLSGPEKWTQYAFAKTKDGSARLPGDNDACCWCIWGGIVKVSNSGGKHAMLSLVARACGPEFRGFANYNDDPSRTFADIVALMARMEELAREEAA